MSKRAIAARVAMGVGVGLVVLGAAATAQAGTFGGFGGKEDAYLIGADRVCAPIPISAGTASGMPACHKAAADEVAQLSVKDAKPERGAKAQFAAIAKGRALTVNRDDGSTIFTWTSMDPISRVVDVYASQYQNVIAVEVMIRRGGRDQADVIGFMIGKRTGHGGDTATNPPTTHPDVPPVPPVAPPDVQVADPKGLAKALPAARKTTSPKAMLKAWAKVLAADPDSSEGHYAIAVAHAKLKHRDDAMIALRALGKSARPDAIEFLIDARFDAAFATMREDDGFRALVGLDGGFTAPGLTTPAAVFYTRLMGFGGTWLQSGTSCDAPEVGLTLRRDRTFAIKVRTKCEGQIFDQKFKGHWSAQPPQLVLALPNPGAKDDEIACAVESDGSEDAIRCALDDDLQFVVKPARR